MMRAGGVFVLCIIVNMINIGAQTLHHSTGKKSFRTLQNVVAQSKCMPIISFLNATIMIVSKISTKGMRFAMTELKVETLKDKQKEAICSFVYAVIVLLFCQQDTVKLYAIFCYRTFTTTFVERQGLQL